MARTRPVEEIIRVATGEEPKDWLGARAGTQSARAMARELRGLGGRVSHVAISRLLKVHGFHHSSGWECRGTAPAQSTAER